MERERERERKPVSLGMPAVGRDLEKVENHSPNFSSKFQRTQKLRIKKDRKTSQSVHGNERLREPCVLIGRRNFWRLR